ncbi:MAG: hypothetical protein ACK56I_20895, partial [bacterium]
PPVPMAAGLQFGVAGPGVGAIEGVPDGEEGARGGGQGGDSGRIAATRHCPKSLEASGGGSRPEW